MHYRESKLYILIPYVCVLGTNLQSKNNPNIFINYAFINWINLCIFMSLIYIF